MDDYFSEVEARLGALIEQGAHRDRTPRRAIRGAAVLPRIPFAGLTAAASALLAVVVATVALLTFHHHQAPSVTSSLPPETQSEIAPALVRAFRILRQPLTPADRLPMSVLRSAFAVPASVTMLPSEHRPSVAQLGLLPRLTRRVRLRVPRGLPGLTAWLIPGRHGLCWFTQAARSTPFAATCVAASAEATTNGADVESTLADGTVGLVAGQASAELVDGHRLVRLLPLVDGFYVAGPSTARYRLIVGPLPGMEPPSPVRSAQQAHFGSAQRVIPRASRPQLVATGPTGMRVTVVYEMTCWRTGSDDIGSTSPRIAVRLPADIQLFFPTGSRTRRSCNVAATVTAASQPRAQIRAAIVLR